MPYLYIASFLLLISMHTTCPMDPPMPPPIERTYPINFPPMGFADDPKDDDSVISNPRTIADPDATSFEGMHVADLQAVLDTHPEQAKRILAQFRNPQLFPRSRFIIGDPGTGKTVFSKALAHTICKDGEWSYEYVSSSAFVRPCRNATGLCLRDYLASIAGSKKPILLIFDQLNKIIEYTEDPSDDTALTSSALTHFMDAQERNANIFFLGIMDRGTKISQRLKSRILGRTTRFQEPSALGLQRIIFTSKCINPSTQLHPEVSDEWLERFLADAPTITGRNYRGLALQTHERLHAEDDTQTRSAEAAQITKRHLQTALEAYRTAHKDIEHVDPYESHFDREDRLRKEELQRQRDLITAQVVIAGAADNPSADA